MNNKVELKVYTLEDGIDYAVLDEIDNYVFLANVNDPKDVCIRKDVGPDLVGLDDEAEFNKALKLFQTKFDN